jgi:hypothetical protein
MTIFQSIRRLPCQIAPDQSVMIDTARSVEELTIVGSMDRAG